MANFLMDNVGAAVIGAVIGAIVTGLISYVLLRMQLTAQIKAQVALAAEQARQAAETEQKRMFNAARVAVVTEARDVVAGMTAYHAAYDSRRPNADSRVNEEFYRDTATAWRTVRARLYQAFGRNDANMSELVSLVDEYLATLKLAANGDRDAMEHLYRERDHFIDSTGLLLNRLDPAENQSR